MSQTGYVLIQHSSGGSVDSGHRRWLWINEWSQLWLHLGKKVTPAPHRSEPCTVGWVVCIPNLALVPVRRCRIEER